MLINLISHRNVIAPKEVVPVVVLSRFAVRPPSHRTNTDTFETAYFFLH